MLPLPEETLLELEFGSDEMLLTLLLELVLEILLSVPVFVLDEEGLGKEDKLLPLPEEMLLELDLGCDETLLTLLPGVVLDDEEERVSPSQ